MFTSLYRRLDRGAPYGAGWASGIGPGHHRGELTVAIAGMSEPLPSLQFEFDFPDATTPSDSTSGSGGCSFSAGSRPGGWLTLVGVVGFAALVRRRRR